MNYMIDVDNNPLERSFSCICRMIRYYSFQHSTIDISFIIAKNYNIPVTYFRFQNNMYGMIFKNTIFLDKRLTVLSSGIVCAHELGHKICDRLYSTIDEQEYHANLFAVKLYKEYLFPDCNPADLSPEELARIIQGAVQYKKNNTVE